MSAGYSLYWRIALCACIASAAFAERLPLHIYSVEAGLAHNHVSRIRLDSRGFLWLCTDGGLSRWDGYQFHTYTTADGLPHAHVDDLLETRNGQYWVATDEGLARFQPETRSTLFVTYYPGKSSLSRSINILLEDKDGTILLGTGDGLYRASQTAGGVRIVRVDVRFAAGQRDCTLVNALLLTEGGQLWVGAGSGLYLRRSNGEWERFSKMNGLGEDFVNQVREDREGRIWAGTRGGGLVELLRDPQSAQTKVGRVFTEKDGLPSDDVRDCWISADGTLWVGTRLGLAKVSFKSTSHLHFVACPIVQGIADQSVYWFTESRAGDLWIATSQMGAVRMSHREFHSYSEADGFLPQEVNQVLETADGDLCVVNGDYARRLVQCFDGEGFLTKALRGLEHIRFGYEWQQFALLDHAGNWWFAAEPGLLRIDHVRRSADLAHAKSVSLLTTSTDVRQIFEDSHGALWVGEEHSNFADVAAGQPLMRNRHVLWKKFFLPDKRRTATSFFVEDQAGQIWIGLTGEGGLLRWRNNQFDYFGIERGIPKGEIAALYRDSRSHIWVASKESGLSEIVNPSSDQPRIQRYGRAQGLSSNEIWCITEDGAGQIYAGTGQGVDVLDPGTGHVMRYTADDGLIPGRVRNCFRDRSGQLWFVTSQGISRMVPRARAGGSLPQMFITDLRVRGVSFSLSQVGARGVGPLELGPSQNEIAIGFSGLDDRLRGDLSYQYRLQGVDSAWSKPTLERDLTFAALVPGQYQFEVKATDVYGGISAPALVRFSIRPHLWQRWSIRSLGLLIALSLIYFLHRLRMTRVLELEHVRTRIAADLHDDIGSGLSQIAVLSEVARRYGSINQTDLNQALLRIGSVSRELAESMGDIVWSINPQCDSLSDLLQRMRRFSSDVLSGSEIDFSFIVSAPEQTLRLDTNTRREVYLIFKEMLNNLIRHSACTTASITMSVENGCLTLDVTDNGNGLGEGENRAGHGLRNITERARRMGGKVHIADTLYGLQINLQVPLH